MCLKNEYTFYTLLCLNQILGKRTSKSDVSLESNSRLVALLRALETFCSVVPISVAISLIIKPSRERMQTLYCNFGRGFSTVMKW